MQSLPTKFGDFKVAVHVEGQLEHFVLVHGKPDLNTEILCRIHSECLTGDVFGSKRCDCGPQLELSMKKITEAGAGVIIYMRQEGRGIGLYNKIKAYALQDQGVDTVDANIHLGFEPDLRDYFAAVKILKDLKLSKIRLLTNNPHKVEALRTNGFEVKREALIVPVEESFKAYITTKQSRMGHFF